MACFGAFDEALRSEGFLAMSGQIVDATIVATPKQRNTIEEKKAIKEGHIPADWKDKPAKLAQERPGCALDGQILQGEAARGWECAGGRPRDPRRSATRTMYLDRSGLRPDPQLDDDARRRARRGAARRRSGPDKHGERRLGGYGLPVGEERSNARAAQQLVSRIPSQEAARAGRCLSAGVSPTRRNPKSAARLSGTRGRASERTNGPHRAHDRHSPR